MDKKIIIFFLLQILAASTFSQAQSGLQIIIDKCGSCHKPDGDTPFSLTSYNDIKKRLTTIKTVVTSGYMPPWKADNDYCNYSNDKSLTIEEKKTLLDWIQNGAKEQKVKAAPQAAKTEPSEKNQSIIAIKSHSKYAVKGDNTERFVLFKIPFEQISEHNIQGIEFVSTNKKVVHHVNYGVFSVEDSSINISGGSHFIETDNVNANLKEYDPLSHKPIYYTGWIPGASGEKYPKGFGWTLPKRGVIIFTVHFSATPVKEVFDFGIKLTTTSEAIQRKIKIISFGSGGIGERDIIPNFIIHPNKINDFQLKMATRDAQSVMYVWPHMHLLGKSFKSYAVTPARDTIPLVFIPKWDYKWQEMYRMKKLTKIPAGSILTIDGSYDNTSQNPYNPNSPPATVYSAKNMDSKMEMFTLLMIYVPYKEGDEDLTL